MNGSLAPRKKTWFLCPKPNHRAALRLFCFPYAGAGASAFFAWADMLPGSVELCAVQLPGRENRLGEKPFTDIRALIHETAAALEPYLDLPFALFGHSMGALIAFELALLLDGHRATQPLHLFVSGHSAPQLPTGRKPIHPLPDPEFINELKRINGMATEILADPGLMEILLPILRADFRVAETYRYENSKLLTCPISAMGGLSDEFVASGRMEAWRSLTQAAFSLHMFPGDHFYIHSDRALLIRLIAQKLDRFCSMRGLRCGKEPETSGAVNQTQALN